MQGMGGGMGGMGMMGGMGGMGMMGGMGGMGGFFNVAPGKVGKIRVPTVCLEHGKDEPSPRADYRIVPIEAFTQKPEVIESCKALGYTQGSPEQIKEIQMAAQAATWHYTDGLSWEQLASKVGAEHIHGPSDPYFSPLQLRQGLQFAHEISRRVRANPAYQDDRAFRLTTLSWRRINVHSQISRAQSDQWVNRIKVRHDNLARFSWIYTFSGIRIYDLDDGGFQELHGESTIVIKS